MCSSVELEAEIKSAYSAQYSVVLQGYNTV
jgi:hypothetical protein